MMFDSLNFLEGLIFVKGVGDSPIPAMPPANSNINGLGGVVGDK